MSRTSVLESHMLTLFCLLI